MLQLVALRTEVRALEVALRIAPDARSARAERVEEAWAYRLLAELGSDMITVHAPTGEYLFASPNIEALFGWRPEEVLGRSAYDLFAPEDLERIASSHVDNRPDEITSVRYRYRCKDGSYRWVETRSRAQAKADEMGHIVAFTRDIHEEVQSQQAAEALERAHRATQQRLARHDALVDLPNRRAAEAELAARWDKTGDSFCLALVDVDDLAPLRSAHGWGAVDQTLRSVARCIERALRPGDFAARWDGGTFVLALPLVGDASAVADAVRLAVRDARVGPNGETTVSVGVATSQDCGGLEDLLTAADRALDRARAKGPGRLFFDAAA